MAMQIVVESQFSLYNLFEKSKYYLELKSWHIFNNQIPILSMLWTIKSANHIKFLKNKENPTL